MKILLDTCTFLWIVSDSQELSMNARKIFCDPDNQAYLSSVSAWEILHYIESLPLSEQASFRLNELPQLHRDPFDRMLICQAIEHGLILLTPDPVIRQYPVKTMW